GLGCVYKMRGLALGYLGRPALSAEPFLADPFSAGGERLYRTGDRARWNADGVLEYLGRLDQQVKLRGFRIEPEEIQARLLAQPGVAQAVVVIREGVAGSQLVGYYTGAAGAEAEAEQNQRLRAALQAELPEYMVPAQLMRLAQMPLGPSGKLDTRALPEPVWQQREHVEPQTELQRRIAAIWSEVLGLPRVGLRDDFFELGGHSLLATRIVSRTRQACDVELPLRALFEASELEAFCEQVRAAQAAGRTDSHGAIRRIDREQPVPLSYSQQRMWFLWQLEPDSPAYNVGGLARLSGPLDVARFEAALQALVQRHETLRTTFPSVDGVPVQRVHGDGGLHMDWQDFSALDRDSRQQHLQTLADSEAHRPFDLESGPLLRVCMVKMAEREHYLVVTLHHIVTEGWAMDIFARELGALYEAFLDDRESPLEPLPVQYLDYSVWQREWLESGERQRQLDYWKAQLGNEHPLLELPGDRPRPPVQSHQGDLYRFDLSPELAERVRRFNAARGLTMFMTMTATLAALLYRYSGQQDLRIGAPVANRIRPESEGLIGAFLNTQVLRCRLDGQMSVGELLEQVRQTVIDGQSHQDLPFDHLVEALQPPRSAAYNPLFQVMCNVQRWEFQQTRQLAGMTVEYIANDARATKFDLNLEVTDLDQRLGCCLTYSRDLFDEPRIARMAGHWQNLLEALLGDPQRRIAELPLFAAEERKQLLLAGTAGEAGLQDTLHGLFAARVAASPQAPALTFAGQTLSYAELDARSNRLARVLRSHGVGPEVRVGLALERSLEMVVGLLAILKAGGAYVPLDPDYPSERLAYMLADSGVELLLTQAHLFERLPGAEGVTPICLDSLKLDNWPSQAPGLHLHGDNLAYVIYTSGSTGQPKGVGNTHAALAERLQWMQATYALDGDDVLMQKAPVSFDVSVWECFWPLVTGCRLVLAAPGEHRDPARLVELVRQFGVTTLHFVPPLLQLFIDEPGVAACGSLRRLFSGGEALPAELRNRVLQRLPAVALHNRYGPTETAINVTHWQCRTEDGERSPIGRPLGNVVCRVLDAEFNLLPAGVAGELCIGGLGLALSLIHIPEPTSPSLTPYAV
ncbi:AMP-binding protein, partial [Pseudomonas aeruginosa]|nr:AMP-binding protein [Pseudomonas aeruginosa]